MPKPTGPQWDAYTQELMNAAERRSKEVKKSSKNGNMVFGRKPSGHNPRTPLGPLDEDLINRNDAAIKELHDYGFSLSHTHARGLSIDMGDPDVGVVVGPRADGPGFSVQVHHGSAFESDEEGNFKHPEEWAKGHKAILDVSPQQLPGALVEHLTDPKVRWYMTPPKNN